MSLLMRLAVALASPIKRIDRRSTVIERLLQLPLTPNDVHAVRQYGKGIRLGVYYHWYLEKFFVARSVRGVHRRKATALIDALDATDYGDIRQVVESATGVLIAIPHHAHYVLSMTALAARLGKFRKVHVFYGQPATHRNNAVFDRLHQVLFDHPESGVEVIHDNRQGLAKAIKGLKRGEIVLIMPDAFQDEDATMMVPFCGRLMNAMLGTAVLARKTGSWILPVVSTKKAGFGFITSFGTRIDHPIRQHPTLTPEQARIADYGVIRRVFAQFEDRMANELHYWQNVRGHLSFGPTAELPALADLPALLDAVSRSALFNPPGLVLDLR